MNTGFLCLRYTLYIYVDLFCIFFLMIRLQPTSTRTDTLFPYTTLIRSGQSLDILACLRRDAVARKGKVAGRQDARLGILNVHILDAGQIADIARHHDEALVLHRAGLGAIAHAHIALALVGAAGNEDDARALVSTPPCRRSEEHTSDLQTLIGLT